MAATARDAGGARAERQVPLGGELVVGVAYHAAGNLQRGRQPTGGGKRHTGGQPPFLDRHSQRPGQVAAHPAMPQLGVYQQLPRAPGLKSRSFCHGVHDAGTEPAGPVLRKIEVPTRARPFAGTAYQSLVLVAAQVAAGLGAELVVADAVGKARSASRRPRTRRPRPGSPT